MKVAILGSGPSIVTGLQAGGWACMAIGRAVTMLDPSEYEMAYLGDCSAPGVAYLDHVPLDKKLVLHRNFHEYHVERLGGREFTSHVRPDKEVAQYWGTGPASGIYVVRDLKPETLLLAGCDCTPPHYGGQKGWWRHIAKMFPDQHIQEVEDSTLNLFEKRGRR